MALLQLLVLTALYCGCTPSTPHISSATEARPLYPLLRVIDGDTLTVDSKKGELVIRLREVNTPERGECGAKKATELLERLSRDGVGLEPDGYDRNGRILAHAYTATGAHIGRELVRAGLAHVASYGQPDEHYGGLKRAESTARREKQGLYDPALCRAGATVPIELTDLNANPPGDDLGPNGESVSLRGPPGHSLQGWTIKDTSASHRYPFPPGAVIPEDGRVRVFTGTGVNSPGVFHWGMKGSAVWNNDGDTAFLIAPGGSIVSWLEFVP